jgi:hypothetical protein
MSKAMYFFNDEMVSLMISHFPERRRNSSVPTYPTKRQPSESSTGTNNEEYSTGMKKSGLNNAK